MGAAKVRFINRAKHAKTINYANDTLTWRRCMYSAKGDGIIINNANHLWRGCTNGAKCAWRWRDWRKNDDWRDWGMSRFDTS
jgi:hypothetical protein